jgi:hypothetical protein
VRAEILDTHPNTDLRVYVVWFSMLATDARSRWRVTGHTIDDPRVVHFWDENRVIGTWFAEQANWDEGDVMWDVFYLFGPDAEWGAELGEPIAHGGTIDDEASALARGLDAVLEGNADGTSAPKD